MAQKSKGFRNGELDFWKFIFALVVLFFHGRVLAVNGEKVLFENGAIAVEFFFMVSGFFLIPSVERFIKRNQNRCDGSIFKENISFIGHKITGIMSYLIISVIFSLVMYILQYIRLTKGFSLYKFVFTMAKSLWNILMLNSLGVEQTNINSTIWYISAMFIVMFVLYPIIRKNTDMFVRYICPVVVLLLFGVMAAQGSITGVYEMTDIHITRGLIRAFIGIMIGCMVYEASLWINRIEYSAFARIPFTLVCYGCIAYSLWIMQVNTKGNLNDGYDGGVNYTVVLALAVAVLILSSKLNITNCLFNNAFSAFLGKMSTVLYLTHIPCRRIVQIWFDEYSYAYKLGLMLAFSFAAALLCMFLSWACKKASPKIIPTVKKIFVK